MTIAIWLTHRLHVLTCRVGYFQAFLVNVDLFESNTWMRESQRSLALPSLESKGPILTRLLSVYWEFVWVPVYPRWSTGSSKFSMTQGSSYHETLGYVSNLRCGCFNFQGVLLECYKSILQWFGLTLGKGHFFLVDVLCSLTIDFFRSSAQFSA